MCGSKWPGRAKAGFKLAAVNRSPKAIQRGKSWPDLQRPVMADSTLSPSSPLSDARRQTVLGGQPLRVQISICSEISTASSISMPKYRTVDSGAQVPHRRLMLGVVEQELIDAQVLRAFVNLGRLRPSHGVCAVGGKVQACGHRAVLDDPHIQPGGYVRRVVQGARKEEVFRPQGGLRDPGSHSPAHRLG